MFALKEEFKKPDFHFWGRLDYHSRAVHPLCFCLWFARVAWCPSREHCVHEGWACFAVVCGQQSVQETQLLLQRAWVSQYQSVLCYKANRNRNDRVSVFSGYFTTFCCKLRVWSSRCGLLLSSPMRVNLSAYSLRDVLKWGISCGFNCPFFSCWACPIFSSFQVCIERCKGGTGFRH